MSSIQSITKNEQHELTLLHEKFGREVKITGYSAAAASFLLIGALIVITCGCLCLMLPGVNVVNHVILPAVAPGLIAILISIPLIIASVRRSRDKNILRKEAINKMTTHLDTYKIPEKTRKERVNFILKNMLNWTENPENPSKLIKNTEWTDEYQGKILSDLKEIIGKEKKSRYPRQEKIAKALDKALVQINKKKK